MKKLLALYFSGTGNTKYAVEKFSNHMNSGGIDCQCLSIETGQDIKEEIMSADTVLIGYPIYGSDMPNIMKDFLSKNAMLFSGKQIITLITQFLGSGDGAAQAVKFLRKHGCKTKCISTIHINMPSNISDVSIPKIKNGIQNTKKIRKADKKIEQCAERILKDKAIKNGRQFYSWFIGFFCQRMWYRIFLERKLKSSLKITNSLCINCGKCIECCPAKNLELIDGTVTPKGKCTTCYRCINLCPKKAICLFSRKTPKEQYKNI